MYTQYLEILKDPKIVNLLCSAAVLAVALITYWAHPARFHEHVVVEKAFEFWICKWMFYVVTWGLFSANTDLRFVLAANDFNTIVGLGIVVALWKGDSYDERHTLANLLFLFGLLFSWNFVSLSLGFSVKTWIFPSMTLSLVFISSAAVVVCVRFRSVAAIAFAVVSAVYLLMQLPSYQIVFAKTNADPELLKLLGLAKLAYGGSFFVAFFQPVEGLERALRFRLPFASARLKAALSNPLIVAVLGGVLTELLLMAGKGIWHLITGHPVA